MLTQLDIEKIVSETRERLSKATEAYLKKFGEDSLDRVITHDPRCLETNNFDRDLKELEYAINNFKNGTKMLEDAIKNNKPLEQIPEEMWKNMIF